MHLTKATNTNPVFNVNNLLLLLAVLLVGGCAGPKFQQDFRPETQFDTLKTYSWRKVSTEIPGADSNQLQRLANAHLQAQGYSHSDENPDMLLDMTLISRVRTGSSTGIGLSIGLPIGQHSSIGLGGGKSLANDKLEGVILLDITESKNNDLLWRGSAEGVPMKNFTLKNEAQLDAVLGKLIKQFPPR